MVLKFSFYFTRKRNDFNALFFSVALFFNDENLKNFLVAALCKICITEKTKCYNIIKSTISTLFSLLLALYIFLAYIFLRRNLAHTEVNSKWLCFFVCLSLCVVWNCVIFFSLYKKDKMASRVSSDDLTVASAYFLKPFYFITFTLSAVVKLYTYYINF
jgi:hypothetical protein